MTSTNNNDHSATPANPAFAKDICYSANSAIDSLLHPILNDLMNARATIEAFSEAAMINGASTKLYWPSLMDSLQKITPTDGDLDNAINQIYGVIEKAVAQALQAAAAGAPVDRKQDETRKRDKLVARSLEVTK